MSLRTTSIERHPDFPWIDVADVQGIERIFADLAFLEDDEVVECVSRAGDGNMNLTLRVETDRRSFILKQARPWVEKYDHIAAPWDRVLFEQGFYERVQRLPEVATRMPAIHGSDARSRVLLLEDLGAAADFADIYSEGKMDGDEVSALAAYLHALHAGTRGEPDPEFENRGMRELNHAHIFVVPLQKNNGLELDVYEPGLTDAAVRLAGDEAFRSAVEACGEAYLSNGPCLLHGDFFPGSWLRTAEGPKVIDPEFCFYGDPEFDLGVAVAHFALARRSTLSEPFLDSYVAAFDRSRVVLYSAIEIMRRLIGVAQLPIPPSTDFRSSLLERVRHAVLNPVPVGSKEANAWY